jgi:hypothetical protein
LPAAIPIRENLGFLGRNIPLSPSFLRTNFLLDDLHPKLTVWQTTGIVFA